MSRPPAPIRRALARHFGLNSEQEWKLKWDVICQLDKCRDDAAARLILGISEEGHEEMTEDIYANLKLLEFTAENFKKLRVIRIEPKGNVIQFTGPERAGKTSAVDAIWFLLKGQKGLPIKAVRIGAEKMRVTGRIGNEHIEFIATRTLAAGAVEAKLTIEMIKGKRDTTPEDFMGRFFDILAFDPLEFIHMDSKNRVAKLRETAHVDLDFDALKEAHDEDYKARYALNQERKALAVRIEAMITLDGLPKDKLDEAAIVARLNNAGEANRKAQETFKAKEELRTTAVNAGAEVEAKDRIISGQLSRIETMKKELATAERLLKEWKQERAELAKQHKAAQGAYDAAPAGEPIDVTALTAELQSAQNTNKAIDAWRQKENLKRELAAKDRAWQEVDNRMTTRDEQKRVAVANAKIPVEGLSFNPEMTEVFYNGLPLESLSGGEQIRLSARIAMAANPKLRVLCIRNGEALDENGMKVLADMAIENDFQIWMARVDTSGKQGIVLEDGLIVARNEETEGTGE